MTYLVFLFKDETMPHITHHESRLFSGEIHHPPSTFHPTMRVLDWEPLLKRNPVVKKKSSPESGFLGRWRLECEQLTKESMEVSSLLTGAPFLLTGAPRAPSKTWVFTCVRAAESGNKSLNILSPHVYTITNTKTGCLQGVDKLKP